MAISLTSINSDDSPHQISPSGTLGSKVDATKKEKEEWDRIDNLVGQFPQASWAVIAKRRNEGLPKKDHWINFKVKRFYNINKSKYASKSSDDRIKILFLRKLYPQEQWIEIANRYNSLPSVQHLNNGQVYEYYYRRKERLLSLDNNPEFLQFRETYQKESAEENSIFKGSKPSVVSITLEEQQKN